MDGVNCSVAVQVERRYFGGRITRKRRWGIHACDCGAVNGQEATHEFFGLVSFA
jgi:hypothetical protein